jgi:hypothetical protein
MSMMKHRVMTKSLPAQRETAEPLAEQIEQEIFLIRSQRVMLSTTLALLYKVEARALIQAVKRNRARFPKDFMFPLSEQEFRILKSQIVISSWGGARRALPYAFTEQGVAMLSSVLHSRRAIQVNIEIMRAFVRLRRILASHVQLARKLDSLERKYDSQFKVVFEAIRDLMIPPPPHRRAIGFTPIRVDHVHHRSGMKIDRARSHRLQRQRNGGASDERPT